MSVPSSSRLRAGAVCLAALCFLPYAAPAASEPAPKSTAALTTPPKIKALVQKQKSAGMSGRDYDDKMESFQFRAEIESKEFNRDLEGLVAELFVVGKAVTGERYELLDFVKSPFALPRKGKHEIEGRDIRLEFDDNDFAQFGVKYYGYLLVIKDKDGRILLDKTTQKSFLTNLAKLEKLSIGDMFDGGFQIMNRGMMRGR
jgi:hypothetical protein